jgi:hypothetical protein
MVVTADTHLNAVEIEAFGKNGPALAPAADPE